MKLLVSLRNSGQVEGAFCFLTRGFNRNTRENANKLIPNINTLITFYPSNTWKGLDMSTKQVKCLIKHVRDNNPFGHPDWLFYWSGYQDGTPDYQDREPPWVQYTDSHLPTEYIKRLEHGG